MKVFLFISQNDQSTGEIKVIGGDDLSTLTGKVGPVQATVRQGLALVALTD